MRLRKSHTEPTAFAWSKDAEIERIIEARVAIRCEADAISWRFRLITIETVMMAGLVLVAGLALKQPTMMVVRASLVVGAACFASGVLLIGLSGLSGKLLSHLRRWRAR